MTKAEHRKLIREAMLILARVFNDLHNRKPASKAPKQQRKVTPALRAQVVAYKAAHPCASYETIAKQFNTNIGRVSEILVGKRT